MRVASFSTPQILGRHGRPLEKDSLAPAIAPPLLIADTNIFYKGGPFGILRTTDGGESWHPFNTGFVSTPVTALIAVKGRLYANDAGNEFVTSTDGGESWGHRFREVLTKGALELHLRITCM